MPINLDGFARKLLARLYSGRWVNCLAIHDGDEGAGIKRALWQATLTGLFRQRIKMTAIYDDGLRLEGVIVASGAIDISAKALEAFEEKLPERKVPCMVEQRWLEVQLSDKGFQVRDDSDAFLRLFNAKTAPIGKCVAYVDLNPEARKSSAQSTSSGNEAKIDNPGEPKPIGYEPAGLYERDKWLYENFGTVIFDELRDSLKLKADEKGWKAIGSRKGVKDACTKYAKHENLPWPKPQGAS